MIALLGIDLGSDRHGLSATAGLARALTGAAGLDLGFAFARDAARTIEHARAALPLDTLDADRTAAKDAIWPLSIFRRKDVTRQLDPRGVAALIHRSRNGTLTIAR